MHNSNLGLFLLQWLHSIEKKGTVSYPEEEKFVTLLGDLLSETTLDGQGKLLSLRFAMVNFSYEATFIWGSKASVSESTLIVQLPDY